MKNAGNDCTHCVSILHYSGLLKANSAIHVYYRIFLFIDEVICFLQQNLAVNIFITIIGIRKMLADVSQGQCPEQCIADRMKQHICIAMSHCSFCEWNLYATNP